MEIIPSPSKGTQQKKKRACFAVQGVGFSFF
jgi:hypothetical protein